MNDSAKSNVNVTQPSTSEESVEAAAGEKKSFDIEQGEEKVEERTTKRSSVVRVGCAKSNSNNEAEPSTSGEAEKTLKAQRSVRWSKRLSIDTVQWEKNEGEEEVPKTVKSNEKEGDIEEEAEAGEENVVEYTTKRSSVVRGFDTTESNNDAELSTLALEESVADEKTTIKTVTTQNSQVFFMIGCQRSGSNVSRELSFLFLVHLICTS